jgi:hypothetical protein
VPSRSLIQNSLKGNEFTTTTYDRTQPLEGKTAAEAARIDLGLHGNKWEAIIKKAAKNESR